MLSRVSFRTALPAPQRTCAARRTFALSARLRDAAAANGDKTPITKGETTPITKSEKDSLGLVENEERGLSQAPNRTEIWSRHQRPRAQAMTGPRFEQTDFDLQPQPKAAIELIHKQPVRWTHDRVVACDGGGGPAGHPRIFINTDKPEIAVCTYCGLPFAHEHHRAHLEALPQTSYPLA
ncbi:Uu.00g058550.m01.CDS01 [Anthostomella pinea]|uniref:Uu.00g058550.m01.CDS01 n=1 Tax=Anthostomella pinea TaxID=933095 RepID=A0AAI8VLB7_9PEZI|nr:Uu.00g058550.m01.CDS01 [Anthostomella pinea]